MDAIHQIGDDSQMYGFQRKELQIAAICAKLQDQLILALNVQWEMMFIVNAVAP